MKTLVVLTGPTGVGKTALSLALAQWLHSPVINADSRQIYREIPIGTAAPTPEEQALVPHLFVGTRSLTDNYNAGTYEREALAALSGLFDSQDTVLMVGGAMLYIDAVCNGLDDIPPVPQELRNSLAAQYAANGLEWLQKQVLQADCDYFRTADTHNPQRLLHALEVTLAAGKPYSSFRRGTKKQRPFSVVKICLTRPREQLYARINSRVDNMLAQGLLQEAERVMPLRHLNALNTVGYKELFRYMDGEWTLPQAADMIRRNSRHYAKRQLTWFNADPDMHHLTLTDTNDDITTVKQLIERQINNRI